MEEYDESESDFNEEDKAKDPKIESWENVIPSRYISGLLDELDYYYSEKLANDEPIHFLTWSLTDPMKPETHQSQWDRLGYHFIEPPQRCYLDPDDLNPGYGYHAMQIFLDTIEDDMAKRNVRLNVRNGSWYHFEHGSKILKELKSNKFVEINYQKIPSWFTNYFEKCLYKYNMQDMINRYPLCFVMKSPELSPGTPWILDIDES